MYFFFSYFLKIRRHVWEGGNWISMVQRLRIHHLPCGRPKTRAVLLLGEIELVGADQRPDHHAGEHAQQQLRGPRHRISEGGPTGCLPVVTNIMRTHLPRSQQAVAAVPACALRSLLLLQPQGGRQSRTYMIHAPRAAYTYSISCRRKKYCCSGCFPRRNRASRAHALQPLAPPEVRPTQARGPENAGIHFEWKIPIKWILKFCTGNPL